MRSTLKLAPFIAQAALFAATAGTAQAAVIELAFDTLPSAQGWVYETSPVSAVPETAVFSLAPGMLVQSTVGLGDGRNYYTRPDGVDWARPFSMELRSRLTQDVGSLTRPFGPLGAFGMYASTGTQTFAIIFRPGVIQNYDNDVIHSGFDTAQFHDYRLDVTPGVGYRLFVDGAFVNAGAPSAQFIAPRLLIGDGTLNVQARAEITHYRVAQQDIPEPNTSLLAALGLALAGWATVRSRAW